MYNLRLWLYNALMKSNDPIIVPVQKPRNKHGNDVLMSRPAGRMKSVRDHNRQRDKREARRLANED